MRATELMNRIQQRYYENDKYDITGDGMNIETNVSSTKAIALAAHFCDSTSKLIVIYHNRSRQEVYNRNKDGNITIPKKLGGK